MTKVGCFTSCSGVNEKAPRGVGRLLTASSCLRTCSLSVIRLVRFIASMSACIAVYDCAANWSGSLPDFRLYAAMQAVFVLAVQASDHAEPAVSTGPSAWAVRPDESSQ